MSAVGARRAGEGAAGADVADDPGCGVGLAHGVERNYGQTRPRSLPPAKWDEML